MVVLHFGMHGVSSDQRLKVSFSRRFLCTILMGIAIRGRLTVRISEVVHFSECLLSEFRLYVMKFLSNFHILCCMSASIDKL